nr:1-deoxy-D-xylulose-5-phosphate reductoisomerase [Hydrogenoanaerobacterium sp.]
MTLLKKITILGSTGSIGVQSLAVCKNLGYEIVALSANSSIDQFEAQVREFSPQYAVIADEFAYKKFADRISDLPVKVLCGVEGLCEIAALSQNDLVLNAIVGIAGLRPTIAALQAGHDVALANKESLVAGGKLVTELAQKNQVRILPVDSEHSAIFQCLNGFEGRCKPKKLILTASGGPFFGKKRDELQNVALTDALNHPNWSMGAKITIDSATLMNKGLEVMEAVWLFGMHPQDIEIVIQRESIVHSAVEFSDNSVIAQLGVPDMKIPIQYALTYPERHPCEVPRLSLKEIATLTFYEPDTETFECLSACIEAITRGGLYPAVVNGANEQAVKLFLAGKISFLQIGELVHRSLNEIDCSMEQYDLDDVFRADRAARDFILREVM